MRTVLGANQQLTHLVIFDQTQLVIETYVVRPVLPVLRAFPSNPNALGRRIAKADDGARVDRRARTGGRGFVDVECSPAALR